MTPDTLMVLALSGLVCAAVIVAAVADAANELRRAAAWNCADSEGDACRDS